MSYSYIFLSEAQEEYETGLEWYLERSLKAAEGFVSAVDHALDLACNHPQRWRNEYGDYYELNLKKYPFSLIYLIDVERELLLIVSVYQHYRNPVKKYRK